MCAVSWEPVSCKNGCWCGCSSCSPQQQSGTSWSSDFHFRTPLPLGVHLTEAAPLEFEIPLWMGKHPEGRGRAPGRALQGSLASGKEQVLKGSCPPPPVSLELLACPSSFLVPLAADPAEIHSCPEIKSSRGSTGALLLCPCEFCSAKVCKPAGFWPKLLILY